MYSWCNFDLSIFVKVCKVAPNVWFQEITFSVIIIIIIFIIVWLTSLKNPDSLKIDIQIYDILKIAFCSFRLFVDVRLCGFYVYL